MLRPLSRGEIESMLAGEKPGVNKEMVRRILPKIHHYKFKPMALQAIDSMQLVRLCNQETCRLLKLGVERAVRR
jgi:hypothetical protein